MSIRSYLILILSLAVFSCQEQQDSYTFSISGKLKQIYSGEVILYRATDLIRRQYDPVDTLLINQDSSFHVKYDLEPHYYVLSLYDSMYIPFIADTGQQISIELTNGRDYKVSGSEDTKLFDEYEAFRVGVLRNKVYPIRGQLYELIDKNNPDDALKIEALGLEVAKAEESYRDTLLNAVKKMGTSLAIYPTMVRWDGDKHMGFYETLTNQFVKEHQGLEITKLISEKVRIMKQVSLGGKVADINVADSAGISTQLYQNLGRYTLIDFWGSWCAPCRAESEKLSELYYRYKDAGFSIYGYAVEQDRNKWVQAIKKDQRAWPNVSSLDWYSNETCAEYGITALPKNFLVDANGVIVGKDLHGEELENKLIDLFNEATSD